ncbi:MAG: SAM-dependent methyltransferase, partial [Methylocystis sp.]|nr:SAM-dependent methyltransferase [Methylocystis sp.]
MNIPFQATPLQESPTPETYDEACYLAVNPDVAEAIASGRLSSGWTHFKKFGRIEGRRQKVPDDEIATSENFDEARYLARNPDVRRAIEDGSVASARAHFDLVGRAQGRRQQRVCAISDIR